MDINEKLSEINREDAEFALQRNRAKNAAIKRRKSHRKHKEERLKNLNYGYKPSLGRDKGGYWVPAKSSRAQKFLKKVSNRKVRKNEHGSSPGGYKRVFDYWYHWF